MHNLETNNFHGCSFENLRLKCLILQNSRLSWMSAAVFSASQFGCCVLGPEAILNP